MLMSPLDQYCGRANHLCKCGGSEMEVPGEKRVWDLVVDKARAWILGLPNVEDRREVLEKLAGDAAVLHSYNILPVIIAPSK
jgi:hypothetical protein